MSKYKALFYREFIVSKKLILTQTIAMIGIMIFFWLIAMSMEFGNLKSAMFISYGSGAVDYIMNKEMKMLVMYFLGFTVAFGTTLIKLGDSANADINTNWRMYAFTLPVSSTEKALVELVLNILGVMISFVLSILNFAVLGGIYNIKVDFGFVVKIWSIFILSALIMNFFQKIIIHRARTKKEAYPSNFSSIICWIVMIVAFTIIIKKPNSGSYYFNIDMDMLNIPEKYRLPADMVDYPIQEPVLVNLVEAVDLLGMLAFPLMILILMAGFFINRRMMERRYD